MQDKDKVGVSIPAYVKTFLSAAIKDENTVHSSLKVLENSIEEFRDFTFLDQMSGASPNCLSDGTIQMPGKKELQSRLLRGRTKHALHQRWNTWTY
ncbi:hypothetical protein MUG91_G50n15 [Manis pentadactyla]|nr:hypothetical protein MUG91_G50n15 [Manis pentadactyla]